MPNVNTLTLVLAIHDFPFQNTLVERFKIVIYLKTNETNKMRYISAKQRQCN